MGDVPLYLLFPLLYIPFCFPVLSLLYAEQQRISVAWGIPGSLSLLVLLPDK